MASRIKDLNLDLQSQDESVVERAMTELQTQDLTGLEPRISQNLLTHCTDKLHSSNIGIRAGALSVLVKLYKDGQSDAIGPSPSAASKPPRSSSSRSSRSSRGANNQAESLAKKIQTPSMLDLAVGSTGNSEHYANYHSSLCNLITELQLQSPRKFMPGFKPIGQYLVQCTGHENLKIATAACEYWAKLKIPPVQGKMMDQWVPPILTKLQTLIPALLKNMVYNQKQADYLESGQLGEDAPPEMEQYSNLRNFSALGFENLCQIFQNEITAIFKPLMEKRLTGDNWQEIEATLLALSAYIQAMGVTKEMRSILPGLMPKLLEFYSHPKPLVRAISCFTLQQFINKPIKGVKDPFSKMLKCSSKLLGDSCPEVQTMAMRSLTAMLAFADKDIAPFKDKLVTSFMEASGNLQGEARFSLYESIGHLYGRMGAMIEEEEDTKRLLGLVMAHWDKLVLEAPGSSADEVMMVCQPMCVIAMYAKSAFQPYNSQVLGKVAQYLGSVCQNGTHSDEDQTTKLVSVLDLTSAMFEGQGKGLAQIASECSLVQHCLSLLQASNLDGRIHQSALAVLGHMSQCCYSSIRPHLSQLLSIIKQKLDVRGTADPIKNNALWALAFMAQNETSQNEQMFTLITPLLDIIKNTDGDQGCVVNAALALTNLCAAWPQNTVSVLIKRELFQYLCALLQTQFPRDQERDTIFKNLCMLLEPNLNKVPRSSWDQFCIAAATIDTDNQDLINALTALLKNLRTFLGNKGWNVMCQQVGPQLAITLRKRYKLY